MSNAVPPPPPPPFSNTGYNSYSQSQSAAPPLPPLPPDFRVEDRSYDYESPPHFEDPMAAPRPHRVDPSIPGNMARTLDESMAAPSYLDNRLATPAPPPPPPQTSINYNPGFTSPYSPSSPGPSMPQWSPWVSPQANASYSQPQQAPLPIPQGALSPAQAYQAQVSSGYGTPPTRTSPQQSPSFTTSSSLSPAMAALSFNSSSTPPQPRREPSLSASPSDVSSSMRSSNTNAGGTPALTTPLPTIQTLSNALSAIQNPTHDPNLKIAWCRDVNFLVNRAQQTNSSTDPAVGPVKIADPQLLRLSQVAVPLILQLASSNHTPQPMPVYVAEAVYLRASFAASGGFPDYVPHSLRTAFRDFEMAARGGYSAAWFRLGRDYEGFNDFPHAKDCFERGVKLGVESCTYRMGMAHLMGQLGLPSNPDQAVPLLHRAAILASSDVPQPAYVFGLLLLNEFAQVTVPQHLFTPFITVGSTIQNEARRHLERAAYLNFAPAQYKLGHAYEFAQPPFLFDPLLSVQYYSLASQQGETEADMALSKWFLCGAEGAFDKDEALAYTFAEKAARKGLPSAEFALGYYAEVGVGGPKDVDAARRYYQQAADHGNADAIERLKALSQPSPHTLSRQEHDTITEVKLVRKRTQAKQRSDSLANAGQSAASTRIQDRPDGRRLINSIRNDSMLMPAVNEDQVSGPGSGIPGMPLPQSTANPHQPRPHHEHQQSMPLPHAGRPRPGSGQHHDPHRAGSMPGGGGFSAPSSPPSLNATPLRPQQGGRPPTQQGFSLADPGSGSASPAGRPASNTLNRPVQHNIGTSRPQGGAGGRPPLGGRIASGASSAAAIPPVKESLPTPKPQAGSAAGPSKKVGPATFAEMGIATSKVSDDKDCVIM